MAPGFRNVTQASPARVEHVHVRNFPPEPTASIPAHPEDAPSDERIVLDPEGEAVLLDNGVTAADLEAAARGDVKAQEKINGASELAYGIPADGPAS